MFNVADASCDFKIAANIFMFVNFVLNLLMVAQSISTAREPVESETSMATTLAGLAALLA